MAIVRLAKLTLFGLLTEKEPVLSELQSVGCTHLIPMRQGSEGKVPTPEIAVEAHEAIKYLKSSPIQRPHATRPTDFDFPSVVREVLDIKGRDRELQDELDLTRKAIDDVRPWGEFHLPESALVAGMQLYFYLVPVSAETALTVGPWIFEIVRRGERKLQVVIISEREPTGVPGQRVELDRRPLSELERHRDHVENELERLRVQRGGLTRWTALVEHCLHEADDRACLTHAMQQTHDDDRLFVISAWAPWADLDGVRRVADRHQLALTVEEPNDADAPPTLLRNPEFLAGGESAVTFYLMPGYRWWDPTIVVLLSFAIFFAMIIADAGYSTMIATLLGIFWAKLSKTVDGRRLRNMILLLTITSITWGVMINSYFGLSFPVGTLPARLHVIDTSDYNFMMKLSIIVGVLHLVIANGITAWRQRSSLKGLAPLGWVLALVGGLLFGLAAYEQLPEYMKTVGGWMLGIGIAAGLSFSSDSFPPTSVKAVFLWLADAVKGLMMVSAAFGDSLSYLRLFALGLSGAQLATTFNKLAVDSVQSFGAIGLVLAIVIILIGHSLNFVLAIMGGVVHGLRLNCIEFFNWCATEEGYPFRRFSKKAGA